MALSFLSASTSALMPFSLSASARSRVAASASSFSFRSRCVISTTRDSFRSSITRSSSVLADSVARVWSAVTSATSVSNRACSSS